MSDTTWQSQPVDPHNPVIGQAVELEEIAPPGCEVVIEHGDRLWMAGGYIEDGGLAFSKVKEQGEGVGWNDLAGTLVVDVNGEPTASLSTLNDILVIFQRTHIHLQEGLGPDNLGNGGFPPARLLPTADGATTHDGTASADPGVVFWSIGGPRLLNTSFQVVHIGAPVEPLAELLTPRGVIAMPGVREIRWYTELGQALLWDYTPTPESNIGRWAVWTGLKVAGAALTGHFPFLVLTDGDVLFEDPSYFDDGGAHFALTFSTWELRPGDLVSGSNLVVKIGLAGVGYGPHNLKCWVFYDGANHWTEFFEWDADTDLYLTPMEDLPFFLNLMDELASFGALGGKDGVYKFNRHITRGPFSTLRLMFSDGGAHNNTFEPHEVALEIGARTGLHRPPIQTYINQNVGP